MKAILMSIRPEWCAKIESGVKTIEVRKTRPKIETPFKCYIYCTFPQKPVYDIWINRGTENRFLGNGKVIGEFVCDMIEDFQIKGALGVRFKRFTALYETCLKVKEMRDYAGNSPILYGWHISELKIYDKPKDLGENGAFKFPCLRGGEDFDTHRKCVGCKYARLWTGTREIYCDRWVIRAPQSWCYVEELED